ncbi:MAG: Fic family protein [Marinobacter sp.]|uniref:DUF4172 domain-containing protein n=1 Tax=Marinobacter sp. TaxID=50741 RepID=UPI0034A048F6
MVSTQRPRWIWEYPEWPELGWSGSDIGMILRRVTLLEGELIGAAGGLAGGERAQELDGMLSNILSSAAIEGERLDANSVRSSLAKRLNLASDGSPMSPDEEGIVQVLMDATSRKDNQITKSRLLEWHTWLFPADSPSADGIIVGDWRGDDPMRVVSGPINKRRVHYEAPPRDRVDQEMDSFIAWVNSSTVREQVPPEIMSALAHLWFVTIHPFDDGNGRIARAIGDFVLARADGSVARWFALPTAIYADRRGYYSMLENTQKNSPVDVTPWVRWYLSTMELAITRTVTRIRATVDKTRLWKKLETMPVNDRQRKVLNKMLDSEVPGTFKLTRQRYQSMTKSPSATATRDIRSLVDMGVIETMGGSTGRGVGYQLTSDWQKGQ